MEGLSEKQKHSAKHTKDIKNNINPPLNYQFYAFRDNRISICV